MLCLRDATPTQLGPVVRALSPSPPWAESGEVLRVCLRATEVLDVPPGSLVLLRVRVEDLDWLNVARPLFAERMLRTVLWADAEAHEGLVRRAVDLFDWVSRTVSVPAKPVPDFAVERMRTALDAGAEIAWRGEGLAETLMSAGVADSIELHVEHPYLLLLRELRGEALPIFTGIRTLEDVWRIRLALAEVGRGGSWIGLEVADGVVGLEAVHARQLPWDLASARLERAGWEHAALLAAWVDLEPERIDVAVARVGEPVERSPTPPDASINVEADADLHAKALDAIEDEVARTPDLLEVTVDDGALNEAQTLLDEWSRRASDAGTRKTINKWRALLHAQELPSESQRPLLDPEILLARQAAMGDRRASNLLVERYYKKLLPYFSRRVPADDAAELTQRTFESLWRLEDLPHDRKVSTLMFSIARNLVNEYFRSRRTNDPLVDDLAAEETLLDAIERNEEMRLMLQAMQRLPLSTFELLELRHVYELTPREIAETRGISVATVRSQLSRAHERLHDEVMRITQPSAPTIDLDAALRGLAERKTRH